MNDDLVFLSAGRLYYRTASGEMQQLSSKFAESVRDRSIQIQKRFEWKSQGPGAMFASGGQLFEMAHGDLPPAAICGMTRGKSPSELLYVLRTPEICGLFSYDLKSHEEVRLFHSNSLWINSLDYQGSGNRIACAVMNKDGTSSIGLMKGDGGALKTVTAGDCIDGAPRWHPKSTEVILFHSAGVGRNAQGMLAGLGPHSIKSLDLAKGQVDTLMEDSKFDFLSPRMNAAGELFAIRKPYDSRKSLPFHKTLLDVVLMPFRLVGAIFHYLNFFSIRYSGKPLSSAGGNRRGPDMRQMMIWGNMIKACGSDGCESEMKSLVPNDWELVKITDGKCEVMGRGVLAFDLVDGAAVVTNGAALGHSRSQSKIEPFLKHSPIDQVMVLRQGS